MKDVLPREIVLRTTRGEQSSNWHEIIDRNKCYFIEGIELFKKNAALKSLIDVEGLAALMASWPNLKQPLLKRTLQYRYVIGRAFILGKFVMGINEREAST